MIRASRSGAFLPLLVLVVALAASSADVAALAPPRQDESAQVIEVGSGPLGERSLNLNGRAVHRSGAVELFGYVTAIAGLDAPLLFANSAPSVETARFTFSGEIGVEDTSPRGDVTTTSGPGRLRVYFSDAAGATWSDPASFAGGQQVAEWSIQLWETVQRQAPGVGVVVGNGRLTQTAAQQLSLDGETYRFGKTGVEQRLRYVGAVMSNADPGATLTVGLTGGVTVTVNEVVPVKLGTTASPAAMATPRAETQTCSDLKPWLSQSRDGLSGAAPLASQFAAAESIDAIDTGALDNAVPEMGALVAAQRASAVPAIAADQNRLVVTALSTMARGLQTIASGVGAGDVEMLKQGQGVLADGTSLAGRASESVEKLAATCADAG